AEHARSKAQRPGFAPEVRARRPRQVIMHGARLVLPFLVLFAVPTLARAQETLDDIEKAKPAAPPPANDGQQGTDLPMGSRESKAVSEVNGYVATRFQLTEVNTGVPLPTQDIPTWSLLAEGNIQLKVSIGKSAFVYSDLSLFYQTGGVYYARDV